jgi:putative sterol carrier protein
MPVFSSAEEFYELYVPFLEQVSTGHLKKKFLAINSTFKVNYSDPDAVFFMDNTQDPPVIKTGDAVPEHADIVLTMSADDGHTFWLGDLNVTKALATRRVKFAGPLMKLLGLLPAFQPAFAEYRKYLEATGRTALL